MCGCYVCMCVVMRWVGGGVGRSWKIWLFLADSRPGEDGLMVRRNKKNDVCRVERERERERVERELCRYKWVR